MPTRPSVSLAFTARAHAQQGGGPWERLLAERAREPEPFVAFAQERSAVLAAPTDEDIDLTIPAGARRDLLVELESLRTRAERARRAGNKQRAAALFECAANRALDRAPYLAAGFTLRVAELRVTEQTLASPSWTLAVGRGLAVLDSQQPPLDPGWWSRALELRRDGAAWPPRASEILARHAWPDVAAQQLAEEPPAALAGAAIGRWRAARHEPQAALIALRQAQEVSRTPWARGHLQLLQARALLALEQHSAASALLMSLADRSEDDVAQAAVALLGTLRLRNGQLRRGFGLLRQAVEEGGSPSWPFQAEAEADLGLAYLVMANEERGLHYLHVAQRRFQRKGNLPALRRCLKNELRYLDHQGHEDQAEAVRDRCLRLGVD